MKARGWLSLLCLSMAWDQGLAAKPVVNLGVLAYRGPEQTLRQWAATAHYLDQKIPAYQFRIVPLNLVQMDQAVAKRELDFILTNPGHFVKLEARHGVTPIATLKSRCQQQICKTYGSTIIVHSSRKDLRTLSDLYGKSLMAVNLNAFGGFELAWLALLEHGIDPFTDLADLRFAGFPHDKIVYAVQNRTVDAGVVRSSVLESMAAEGKIRQADFRVLNPRQVAGFPFALSTALFPEWPLAKAAHTADALAEQLAVALLEMPKHSPAARTPANAGWTVPLNYQAVHEIYRRLQIGPYRNLRHVSVTEVVHQYWHWLFAALLCLGLSALITLHVLQLNTRLKQFARSLESEVSVRKRVEQALKESRGALHELHRITSSMNLGFSEKIQALLEMGRVRFGLPIGILARVDQEQYHIVEVVAPPGTIFRGDIYPMRQAFCCETLKSHDPISFECAAESHWRRHPAYAARKLEAYIGMRVVVEGRVYGTLNFMSPEPRRISFNETDKEILKLMAQWVAGEIHRKWAKNKLAENETRLRTIIESEPEWVCVIDEAGTLLETNPAGVAMVDADNAHDILNTSIYRFIAYPFRRRFEQLLLHVIAGSSDVMEFKAITLQKRTCCLEMHAAPLRDPKHNTVGLLGIIRDVTDRKLAEERARRHQAELAHVARLSTMGQMASMLAHELNQPLAAILNYTRGCARRLQHENIDFRQLLTAMHNAVHQAERAGEIIRRTRDFVRKRGPHHTIVDINDMVTESAELALLEARKRNISIRLNLSRDLPRVTADNIQIEQVILNLAKNGMEAIEDKNKGLRRLSIFTGTNQQGEILVTVRDTGKGIGEQDTERLFEPFFSTKPNGVGMGLSISRSIIEAHGGRLWMTSVPERGTDFQFTLPTD